LYDVVKGPVKLIHIIKLVGVIMPPQRRKCKEKTINTTIKVTKLPPPQAGFSVSFTPEDRYCDNEGSAKKKLKSIIILVISYV